ncbi:MAG: zf-HC2 domain-containing protein [Candidatus Coatesbacteria bacterium]|nr:zf-HC2 domain-containing protein [Candidatus Coatesbacteria bacterium]
MQSCQFDFEYIIKYLYNELSEEEQEYLENHLFNCEKCREMLEKIRKSDDLLLENLKYDFIAGFLQRDIVSVSNMEFALAASDKEVTEPEILGTFYSIDFRFKLTILKLVNGFYKAFLKDLDDKYLTGKQVRLTEDNKVYQTDEEGSFVISTKLNLPVRFILEE